MSDTAVQLNILGHFRIDGGSARKLPNKAKGLLTFLAIEGLEGRPVSRSKLASLLWPHQGNEQGLHSLRNCLLEIRRGYREVIDSDFYQCRLASPSDTDAWRFGKLAQSSSRTDLHKAAELYRGELAEDLEIPSEAWQEWLDCYAEQWRSRLARVLANLCALSMKAGDHEGAISAARRLTRLEEYDDNNSRLLMAALEGAGRNGEAAREYKRFAQKLRDDLNTLPETENRALMIGLLSQRQLDDNGPSSSRQTLKEIRLIVAGCLSRRRAKEEDLQQIIEKIDTQLRRSTHSPTPEQRPDIARLRSSP